MHYWHIVALQQLEVVMKRSLTQFVQASMVYAFVFSLLVTGMVVTSEPVSEFIDTRIAVNTVVTPTF
jgi:uncharacterized membrane protein